LTAAVGFAEKLVKSRRETEILRSTFYIFIKWQLLIASKWIDAGRKY
jgi:hypothetical protein